MIETQTENQANLFMSQETNQQLSINTSIPHQSTGPPEFPNLI